MRCKVTKIYGNVVELLDLETKELFECDLPKYIQDLREGDIVEFINGRMIRI
jgi:hypothetical protein